MLNLNPWRTSTVTRVRLIQLIFLIVLLWFFFWAHIYEMIVWNKSFVESLYSSIPNVLIYLISLSIVISLEVYSKRLNQTSITSNSKVTENFYAEKEQLNKMSLKEKNSNIIQIPLLITGTLLLVFSIVVSSTIITFIGLSLTFWGILFLLTMSKKYVASNVFEATNVSSYTTLDRIISDLDYNGNAIFIPSLSEDNYLPEHLSGLKEMILFISSKKEMALPSLEKLVGTHFLIKNPEGICITPPGSGLVSLFENELKTSLTNIDAEDLYDFLPKIIVAKMELANNLEINPLNGTIHVKIIDSIYANLYSKKENLKSVNLVGCPLVNALGCSLANATRELVTLTQTKVSPNLKTIEVWFKLGAR